MIPNNKLTLSPRSGSYTPPALLGLPPIPSSPKRSREPPDEQEDQSLVTTKKSPLTELSNSFVDLSLSDIQETMEVDDTHSPPSNPLNGSLDALVDDGKSISEMELDSTADLMETDAKHEHPPSDDLPNIYIVIEGRSSMLSTGIWDTASHTIRGVYQSEKDANNRVLSLYEEAEGGRKFAEHQIRLWKKGHDGDPFYHWETSGVMINNCHVRVHVEKWSVMSESDEAEKWVAWVEHEGMPYATATSEPFIVTNDLGQLNTKGRNEDK